MNNVKKFYEALKSDQAMVEELKKQLEAVKPETEDRAAELVAKLAAEKGYAFSAEEFKAMEAETRSLDKEELDKINAAGSVWPPWTCSVLFR